MAQANSGSIFGAPPTNIEINYRSHAGQVEVSKALRENFKLPAEDRASIIEVIASRGWGKTLYFCCEILTPYLETHPNARIMWVAPTYLIAMSPVDDVFKGVDERTNLRYIPEFCPAGNRRWQFSHGTSGPTLRWHNGATVVFRSADSPDSIVSKGFNLIIIDEAALIAETVFNQQIMGTARKEGIKIFLISTPRGKKHWTYKIFLKGQDTKEKQYLSFQQPYTKNPYFSPVLAKLINDLPDWLRRQEYLAEFIEDGDSVFRGIEHVLFGPEVQYPGQQQEWMGEFKDITVKSPHGDVQRRASERKFVAALDLAKSIDYTVLTVMDCETGEVIYYKRINKTDYRDILNIAARVCANFNNAELVFDATGVGAGLADVLNNYDIITHPFVFTNESKNEIINKLAVSIEYQEIHIPNIVTIKNELAVFTYSLTKTGKISYNAPAGYHDDIVISLALANWYRKDQSIDETVGVIDEIIKHNSSDRPRSYLEEMAEDDD